jgi:hypothetical protein
MQLTSQKIQTQLGPSGQYILKVKFMMLLATLESWNNHYDSQVQATSFKLFCFV